MCWVDLVPEVVGIGAIFWAISGIPPEVSVDSVKLNGTSYLSIDIRAF